MYVLNKCRVDYKYRLSSCSPIVSKTVSSNMVSTQIIREKLKVVKFVDKDVAGLFDSLKYTIVIYNISNDVLSNIFFKDDIPKGTIFIENSVTINNIKNRCINPNKGFYIRRLKAEEKVKIAFKVIILKPKFPCITNNCNIEYDYIYNIEEKPIKRLKVSNLVETMYKDNLFKEVLLRDCIHLCDNIDSIIKIRCIPKIINAKLINCYVKDKCGLLILGKLNYIIFYKSNNKVYFSEYISGFSICMLVPKSTIYLNEIDIKIDLEYMCSKINKNSIFINSLFLISF